MLSAHNVVIASLLFSRDLRPGCSHCCLSIIIVTALIVFIDIRIGGNGFLCGQNTTTVRLGHLLGQGTAV